MELKEVLSIIQNRFGILLTTILVSIIASSFLNLFFIDKVYTTNLTPPNMLFNLLLCVLIGIIGGLVLIFFMEYMDDTIKEFKIVEEKFKIPILARTPNSKEESPSFDIEKFYIKIASTLNFLNNNYERLFLVTSSLNVSKTEEFIKRFSIMMADIGKHVLILDCDFQNSQLSHEFKLEDTKGLMDILRDKTENKLDIKFNFHHKKITKPNTSYYKNYIQYTNTPNLEIMPSGTEMINDNALLFKELTMLLPILKKDYDLVLINVDTITCLLKSLLLDQVVDGIILFEHYGESTFNGIKNTLEKLETKGNKIKGIVVNNAPLEELEEEL